MRLPSASHRSWSVLVAAAMLLVACTHVPPAASPSSAPAPSSVPAPLVATAHPLATRAALAMIERGGTAADAAVAAQMVLGLVEPQSSGVGGGTLALYWQAATGQLTSLDGLAAAPARATAGLAVDADGSRLPAETVRRGGRSVGVPGTLALFEQLHARQGRLPWAVLFEPAIELATNGFPMPPYLHEVLASAPASALQAAFRDIYFGADGKLLPIGATVRNPAYADTLREIAARGRRGWLEGGAAHAIVEAARQGLRPTLMSEQDLLDYRAEPREPLCGPFLRYRVCVMGPSSYGGVTVLQLLQIAQDAVGPAGRWDFDDPEFVHVYAEAGRLAEADRLRYVGDPGYTAVPLQELLAAPYLQQRAARIDPQRALAEVTAGDIARASSSLVPDTTEHVDATSQMAIVDAAGNALSVTTTVNLNFGSWLTVGGFVLNNAMTNFAPAPRAGSVAANQMAPGKRPVSSMSPTIVFDERGVPVVVGGSAGGGQIVDYVAQSLIELLALGHTPAQALARGHVSTAQLGFVELERGTPAAALKAPLEAMGHRVAVGPMQSGLAFLKREGAGWIGAADPRRDGAAASATN